MIEYSSFTSLVGPDGTTITLNGSSGLVLTDCSGFDGANVRTNIADLPETDGGIAGDGFLGQRSFTITADVIKMDAGTRNVLLFNLMRALRGLRSDFTLKAAPSGMPAMQIGARLGSPLRITGQWKKTVLISGIAADPRIYSQAANSQSVTQAGTPATPGAAFPWTFPVNWGGGGGAFSCITAVTNAGNFSAPCTLKCTGPITSPQFTDAASGSSIYVDGITLAAGVVLSIDTNARTVVDSLGNNFYGNVRFPGSTWFGLDPGSNSIQLWGSATTAATALEVDWRDTWA